ncbi:hypothetical protein TWF106_004799 [Orbilia oligospora]|uniref:Phospho-2-dehydro-3-deoxyheptonate aldolase n=1 Tax=Orbilia oligospora TaxID=2813651 RepID=A0A6G1M7X0_ORBOL|nr:hypothetical protein TWF788_003465 [Orbilia oligospora]KAF3198079.1 hypothetical protein TWF106_004799 [Orbilia oligospora]KAF3198465.1 hypothetical protein TWF679_002040 [Orbilia oligospora]KAF3228145.1 hypothetical protein TWF191_003082 [Orbilia oligospora]KAF3247422.1 hypothetical protein TWF192_006667 [Orbilia oligospora]
MATPPVHLPLSEAARGAARLRTSFVDSARPEAAKALANEWAPSSWQSKPIKQEVIYPDQTAFEKALSKLESLPMIVHPTEINNLKSSLKDVCEGKAFLLQGGDCAELFDYCTESQIDAKIALLLQMSLVLIHGLRLPVVRIGRIAGQFAKPRSSPTEIVDGKEIPSFRGDNINGFDPSERTPEPSRLVQAYFHSSTTLNYIRTRLGTGYADLHHPFNWSLSHIQDSEVKAKYLKTVEALTDSLSFMKTIGADTASSLRGVDFYTSHEGLLLEYEQSFTRKWAPTPGVNGGQEGWYNTSAHFIWIGDRTRQLDGAHVEYFRGIENPIGIKVGPSFKEEEFGRLLDIVNPRREPGKVTLITRYGCDKVENILPGHIEAVRKTGHPVIWQCDPMHGNTRSSPGTGLKTRQYSSIMSEILSALKIHKEKGTWLGGIHLELTGDNVTECVGGSEGLTDDDLSTNYQTYCDPRLNEKQALDVAFTISDYYRKNPFNT